MEIEVPKFRRVPREIGSETSNVDIIERNRNDGLLLLDIKIDHETTIVPVFDLREDSHKREIAKVLISGDPVAAFGVGNYGIAIGIDHPKRGRFPNSWEHYWKFKPDRPRDAKIPILMPPKYWSEIIDFRKIHSGFKPLFNRGQLERAYREAVIFHIVAPSYNYAPHINHPALVTAEDGKNSVSAFWWDDPDLEEIADIAMRLIEESPQVSVRKNTKLTNEDDLKKDLEILGLEDLSHTSLVSSESGDEASSGTEKQILVDSVEVGKAQDQLDIEYKVFPMGVKEDIILNSVPANLKGDYRVEYALTTKGVVPKKDKNLLIPYLRV